LFKNKTTKTFVFKVVKALTLEKTLEKFLKALFLRKVLFVNPIDFIFGCIQNQGPENG